MRPHNPKGRPISWHWHNFWFAPEKPDNLAICRILFFGSFFLFYVFWARFGDFAAWGSVSIVFWKPTWLFGALDIPVLPPDIILVLQPTKPAWLELPRTFNAEH